MVMPAAVLIGFALVAAATYLGLRHRGAGDETPATSDVTLGTDERPAWVAGPSVDASSAPGEAPPRAAGQQRNASEFIDLWRSHAADVAGTCGPTRVIDAGPDIWYVELPLELDIAPDGRVRRSRRFAKIRSLAPSGEQRASDVSAAASDELARCYGEAIAARVRFSAGRDDTQARVWVRIIDQTAR